MSTLLSIRRSSNEKEDHFVNRTNKHIALVKKACIKIVEAYPKFKDLLDRAEIHDASKFKEPERTPYIEISWRHKLENAKGDYDPYIGKGYQTPGKLTKDDENKATMHHILSNSHHPEYHLEDKSDANINAEDRNKSDKVVDASRMPDLDIAEMIADWVAMSEELKTNTAREWYNKQNGVRWDFSKHQEALIDNLVHVFEEEE